MCQSVEWDTRGLIDELTLLVTWGVGFIFMACTWFVACGALLVGWLPPRLVSASNGWLRSGHSTVCRWLEHKDTSLDDLATDLNQLLGDTTPTAWDWTSLLSCPEHAFLHDSLPDLPLPLPSFRAMPVWWQLCHSSWIVFGSIQAWFWCGLWCLALIPPWRLVGLATHVAIGTLLTLAKRSDPTCPLGVVCYASSLPMHLSPALSTAFLPSTYLSPGMKLAQLVRELSPAPPPPLISFMADPLDWKMKLILEDFIESYEASLTDLVEAAHLDVSSVASIQPVVTPSPVLTLTDRFLQSFNPAQSGVRLLLSDRLDQLLVRHRVGCHSVSVNLRRCHRAMAELATSPFSVFPAFLESVFNSVEFDGSTPLVVDTGASCCISPCRADFRDYSTDTQATIKDLSGLNTVAGEGIVHWRVRDRFGREHILEMKAYHIPHASVRLLSPQSVFNSVGGVGQQDCEKYTLRLADGEILLDALYGRANLPVLPLVDPAIDQPRCFWSRCFVFNASAQDTWAHPGCCQSKFDAGSERITLVASAPCSRGHFFGSQFGSAAALRQGGLCGGVC